MPIKIEAFKNDFDYLIIINTSVYEMNDSSHLPNGINMYCGETNQVSHKLFKNPIQLIDLPQSILYSIIQKIQQFDF